MMDIDNVITTKKPSESFIEMLKGIFARYRFPILVSLALRTLSSLWLALLWLFLDPYFPRTAVAIRETFNHLEIHQTLFGRMFLDVWMRWDAVHYMNLAWGGYRNAGAADMNYWPLYPYLVRAFSFVTAQEIVLAGLLVSTIAALIAAVFFWDLVRLLFKDDRLANWTILAWLVFPTSFFLVAPFTEALFACLALASLWMMTKKRWIPAGVLAALAGMTRSQGILLIAPLVLAISIQWYHSREWPQIHAFIGVLIAPLGTIGFMLWRWSSGLPNLLTSFSTYTHARILDPFSSLFLSVRQLFQFPSLLAGTELCAVLLALVIQIWMLTNPAFRKEFPLMTYGILSILFNLTKYITTATPLQSSNRYILSVFPVFIGLGFLLLQIPHKWRSLLLTLSASLGLISLALYAMWVFVG
jgi:hypothetical protein